MSGTHGLGDIPWERYNHQALWDMIESADPKEIYGRSIELEQLAKSLASNADHAQRLMQRILANWSGPAADQAAAVAQPILDWATEAATTASEVANRLGDYAWAVDRAKLAMPNPVDYRQLDAVAEGKAVEIGPLPMNEPELAAMGNHQTATAEQAAAAKAEAVDVMRRFGQQSEAVYRGLPTFPAPPKMGRFSTAAPAPEPTPRMPPVPPEPTQRPPTVEPVEPVEPASGTPSSVSPDLTTTASDYIDGAGLGTGFPGGGPLAAPGAGSGAGIGSGAGSGAALPGIGSGSGGVIGSIGTGARSGAAAAEEETTASRAAGAVAAEEAEQGPWGGFAPMGAGVSGDRDGRHRNRYAKDPDIVGELPPAFPPVLGL